MVDKINRNGIQDVATFSSLTTSIIGATDAKGKFKTGGCNEVQREALVKAHGTIFIHRIVIVILDIIYFYPLLSWYIIKINSTFHRSLFEEIQGSGEKLRNVSEDRSSSSTILVREEIIR